MIAGDVLPVAMFEFEAGSLKEFELLTESIVICVGGYMHIYVCLCIDLLGRPVCICCVQNNKSWDHLAPDKKPLFHVHLSTSGISSEVRSFQL